LEHTCLYILLERLIRTHTCLILELAS
jgi:hypothetical protein